MPKLWKDAVEKIKAASPDVNPYAVATATLQKSGSLKKGTRTATAKGIRRGAHSSAWRERHPSSRAKKQVGGSIVNTAMEDQTQQEMEQAALQREGAKKRGGAVEGKSKRPHLGRKAR